MSSRETVQDKAVRYISQARLTVTAVSGDHVEATCRGDGQVYDLGHDTGRGYHCSCEARTDRCAHLVALRLVVVRSAALRLATTNPTQRRSA